jgi:coenzyme F420-reducing hydrogenase delta subunit
MELKELKDKSISVKFTKLEKIGSLDLKLIFKSIYEGFDGIFVIAKYLEADYMGYSYFSFQKYIDEANKILDKRGFGKERAFLCKWDCLSVNTLISDFKKLLEKIKVSGKNPIYSN